MGDINVGLEKKIRELELGVESQRILAKSKIGEAVRNFDGEKGKIVEEYEAKLGKQESQMEELVKAVRNLRKELEISKNYNEELKAKYSQEHNVFNKKQRDLELELEKKKI